MTTNGTEERPLPDGWKWTTIGKVAQVNYRDPALREMPDELEVTFVPMAAVDEIDGKIADPQVQPLKKTRKGYTPFSEGDVLFAKITPCMENGKAAIARNLRNGLGFGSTEFHVMKPGENVLAEWLFYYVRQSSFRDEAKANFSGTAGQLRVKKNFIVDFPISIPPTLEQERIVAEIEKQFTRLDQAVASLRRLQSNLARYKASVLKAACEGRLVPQDPTDEPADQLLTRILAERRAQWQAANPGKKYKEPVGVEEDTAVLPDLPEGWVWTNMETLIVDGPTNGLYLPKSKYGAGVPILRIDDYQNGESRSSDELRKVAASTTEIQKYSLSKRDMVINRVNSPSHLGKCLVIEERNLPSLFESNMMRMALSENVRPDFVEFYLQSGNGRARLINNAKWAVNQASINQGDVKSTPVPLPPLAEQERIVAEVERRLSVVTAIEQTITTNLSRAERLRQSILHRAFTGQLVPQEGVA